MIQTLRVDQIEHHPAADLFPMLTEEDLRELANDIRANGLHEPVWLWRDPERGEVLLDGRNRVRACGVAGVEVATRWYTGDDPIAFVISENLTRRHLTTGQKAAIACEIEPLYAAEAAQRKALAIHRQERDEKGRVQPLHADLHEAEVAPPSPFQRQAISRAAAVVGTSGRAVAQFKRVQEHAPDLSEKIKAGGIALDRAERIIRDRQAEQRRIGQARAEAAAAEVATIVDIRLGDFREVFADLAGVDAIITDPPYPAEFLPLLGDLAIWADRVLAPEGVLAVLIGQSYLPDVYRLLGAGRPYRWTACYLTEGPGYVSYPRRVQSNWKPLLLYGGGPRLSDVVRSEGSDADAKSHHRWGQDYSAFHTLIERLTARGQTVVDPFMGSGTTLLAARALGRHAVGCDIDAEAVATAQERLA